MNKLLRYPVDTQLMFMTYITVTLPSPILSPFSQFCIVLDEKLAAGSMCQNT